MYATIRIYAEAEGLADAVAENRAEIVGLFREIDGFRAYYIVKTGPVSATSPTCTSGLLTDRCDRFWAM